MSHASSAATKIGFRLKNGVLVMWESHKSQFPIRRLHRHWPKRSEYDKYEISLRGLFSASGADSEKRSFRTDFL